MQAFFLLVLLLAILAPLSTPLALPLSVPKLFRRACDDASCLAATDALLLHASMEEFQAARAAESPDELIWTSDGCTDSPDEPLGFDFLPSCQRHDFGYRNYRDQGRLTETSRKVIDDNLKADLFAECGRHGGWSRLKGVRCRGVAEVYYGAVREFGDNA